MQMRGGYCFDIQNNIQEYECMVVDKIYLSDTEVPQVDVSEQDLSDHSLIEATRHGDEAAFAEIMRRYRSPIVNFLYRFLNDYEEAVDLAQETFVRIYFAIDRYHTSYAFSTYIYRIASNLAISELRRRKRRRILSLNGLLQNGSQEEAADFEPADERKLPDADLVDDEQSRVIGRAISALPEKYRLPLILRDIEGRSYEDVAVILELGLGTTKSRISRARGLLKEKLKGYVTNGDG